MTPYIWGHPPPPRSPRRDALTHSAQWRLCKERGESFAKVVEELCDGSFLCLPTRRRVKEEGGDSLLEGRVWRTRGWCMQEHQRALQRWSGKELESATTVAAAAAAAAIVGGEAQDEEA